MRCAVFLRREMSFSAYLIYFALACVRVTRRFYGAKLVFFFFFTAVFAVKMYPHVPFLTYSHADFRVILQLLQYIYAKTAHFHVRRF